MNKLKDTQELIDLLESGDLEDSTEVIEFYNDIPAFVSKYGIKPGEFYVKKYLLYKLYSAYSEDPLPSPSFKINMALYLEGKNRDKDAFYKINMEALKVTQELYKLLQERKNHTTTSVVTMNHFKNFMDKANVKPGSLWIEGFVLFEVYKRWNNLRGKKHILGPRRFHSMLKVHFSKMRRTSNKAMWFQVTEGYKNYVTEDDIRKIREKRKSEWCGHKKKGPAKGTKTRKELKNPV